MSRCKACGAPIVWIKTPGGKSMPCDAQPVTYKAQSKAKDKIVTQNGEVISCIIAPADINQATGIGYIPHWATCPNADNFRAKAVLK